MIYLISQITFIFLTQIYYEFHHIFISFITKCPSHFEINLCRLFLEDFFFVAQKMHISEYVCKNCLKELGILLKCRESFKKFLAAYNSSKNAGLPKFFFLDFSQMYFKKIYYVDFYEFKTN